MDRRSVKILANTFYLALIAWFLIFFTLGNRPWGANLAICVGYSILAAGVVYADKDFRIFFQRTRRPLILIAIQHACFLIAAIALFRAVMIVEPALDPISVPWLNWGFAIPVLTMWGLAFGEKWLLFRDVDRASGVSPDDSREDSGTMD